LTFLYLNSDQMGSGDPELGRKLVKSFLRELAKSDVRIDAVGCVNSGMNLTTDLSRSSEPPRQTPDWRDRLDGYHGASHGDRRPNYPAVKRDVK